MKKRIYVFLSVIIVSISSYAQNGLYLEYRCSDKGTDNQTDVLKVYSLDGNSLNERTNLLDPNYPTNNLRLKSSPDTVYSLYGNQTFLKIPDKQLVEYKIEILGTENVNGYKCIKISLDTHGHSYQTVWITDQIPLYENYLTAEVNDINLAKLTEALKKKNLKGIPVRITYPEDNSMQYDFVKLKRINMDISWFSIDGYKEAIMMTSEEMEKLGLLGGEEYEAMKKAEIEAQKIAEEQSLKKEKKKE